MFSVGDTLIICTPPNNKEHLFIIIAIERSSQTALLVNITTPKIGYDNTCCISVGEHPFVVYDSVINYADSRINAIANLEYCVKNGIFKKHNPVSSKLLKKIQHGALISPAISYKHRNFLQSNI